MVSPEGCHAIEVIIHALNIGQELSDDGGAGGGATDVRKPV